MQQSIFFNGLSIGYKAQKSRGISIFPTMDAALSPSELTILLGRNGVGKSTLLRTLTGLQAPLSGQLEVMGQPLARYTPSERASLISFVSTERIEVADFSVFDLVALGRYSHTNWINQLTDYDLTWVNEALQMADITYLAEKKINQLSDGELQRVMIARTLAQNTPIIILDEPTAFLDLPNKFEILLLLRRLAHDKEKTILLSTHDLNMAMRLADKLWLLSSEGLYEGAPEDFVLDKKLDYLFADTRIAFDYAKGDIIVDLKSTRTIQLYCEDQTVAFWVRQALGRVGVHTIEHTEISVATLHVMYNHSSDGTITMQYRENEQEFIFRSIYEFTKFLRNQQ